MAETKYIPRLKTQYIEIAKNLKTELNIKNAMEVPRFEKITVNIGQGEAVQNIKSLEAAIKDLTAITGQKPKTTRAKKSIAGFKLREGMPIGACVTLRGARMFEFLDRLINSALPRVRDFKGIPAKGFDGRGNFSMGLKEQIIFPEVDYDKVDKLRGMGITIVTSSKNDAHAKALLEKYKFPFTK